MGKTGDQDINWAQNKTLAECSFNDVDVHLFEVIDPGEYIYCGRIELVSNPYTELQPGEDGIDRKVWMFPIRPVPDNNVKKPTLFVFADMDEYKARGENVEKEYTEYLRKKKLHGGKALTASMDVVPPKPVSKPPVVIPEDIIGKKVRHKSFGVGVIVEIGKGSITVDFSKVGMKKMGYELCMKNNLLEFI